jgi:aminopeptidase C
MEWTREYYDEVRHVYELPKKEKKRALAPLDSKREHPHAVVVVAVRYNILGRPIGVLLENSWGSDFGSDGLFYMDKESFLRAVYRIQPFFAVD